MAGRLFRESAQRAPQLPVQQDWESASHFLPEEPKAAAAWKAWLPPASGALGGALPPKLQWPPRARICRGKPAPVALPPPGLHIALLPCSPLGVSESSLLMLLLSFGRFQGSRDDKKVGISISQASRALVARCQSSD